MKKESKFRSDLKKEIDGMFPGCMILDNDPNQIQGIPDILILHEKNWAALETKRHGKSSRRPNQEYYVGKMNDMSFASFVCPENKQEVLDELQRSFKFRRAARSSKSESVSLG